MKHRAHPGFSVVELLIAITVSFLILGAILQIFFSSKQSYLLSNGYAQLQENGSFLSEYLSQKIRLSGYRSPPVSTQFAATTTLFTSTNPYISATTGVNGSDILTIRYQGSGNGTGAPDGSIRDCLNQPVDSNTIATNIFSINSNLQLQCQAINNNASPNNTTAVLIDGVENMQVLFGEDLNGDNSADRYVTPNYAGINLNNIVSVRVALLLRSTDDINTRAQSNTYQLAGTPFTPALDRKIRKIFPFSVQLRNRAMPS